MDDRMKDMRVISNAIFSNSLNAKVLVLILNRKMIAFNLLFSNSSNGGTPHHMPSSSYSSFCLIILSDFSLFLTSSSIVVFWIKFTPLIFSIFSSFNFDPILLFSIVAIFPIKFVSFFLVFEGFSNFFFFLFILFLKINFC